MARRRGLREARDLMLARVTRKERGTLGARARGRRARNLERIMPVRALDRGGALTTSDGAVVRVLTVTPLPSAAAADRADAAIDAVAALLDRLQPGEALQWYTESNPVTTRALFPPVAGRDDNIDFPGADGDRANASWSPDPPAIERAHHLVVRTPPRRGHARVTALGARGRSHRRTLARSLSRADEVAQALSGLGLRPRLLDGPAVSRLLLRRLRAVTPDDAEPQVELAGTFDGRAQQRRAVAAAGRLRDLVAEVDLDLDDERRVLIGGRVEHAIAIASVPEGIGRDWLSPLLESDCRYTLAFTTRARANGTLAVSACQAFSADDGRSSAARLAVAVDSATRAAQSATGVRVDRGEFAQPQLWPATLPLGREAHQAALTLDAHTTAAGLPLFADSCGSPGGVPFARGADGRIERLDPWDAVHRHSGILVSGGGAHERDTVVAALAVRLADRGAAVRVVDANGTLADRFEALSLPPQLEVMDARHSDRVLALAGAASAWLSQAVDPALEGGWSADDGRRGALVISGAERLLGEPGAAAWLRRFLLNSRRDGVCLVLAGARLTSLDAAGLVAMLPVRVLLAHEPAAAEALRARFGLASQEVGALRRADAGLTHDATAMIQDPMALWINGARGRGLVRVLAPRPIAARKEAA